LLYLFVATKAEFNGATTLIEEGRTSRDTATPISRPVYMLFPSFNLNPVIDARPR
jgi:hypothetical protein